MTDQQTDRRAWGIIGKLHTQKKTFVKPVVLVVFSRRLFMTRAAILGVLTRDDCAGSDSSGQMVPDILGYVFRCCWCQSISSFADCSVFSVRPCSEYVCTYHDEMLLYYCIYISVWGLSYIFSILFLLLSINQVRAGFCTVMGKSSRRKTFKCWETGVVKSGLKLLLGLSAYFDDLSVRYVRVRRFCL